MTRSSPAADATLTAPPIEIHLWFSEALEVSLTRVTLRGPDGEALPLGVVVADSGSRVAVAAAVRGSLRPGRYTVEWRAMAADGHPSRGEFSFVITGVGARGQSSASSNDSEGAAVIGHRAPPDSASVVDTRVARDTDGFDVGSPLYVAVRWALYLGMLVLTGAVAFNWFVLGRVDKEFGERLSTPARTRSATVGAVAAAVVLAAGVGRLFCQAAVMGTAMGSASTPPGGPPMGTNMSMVLQTSWARSWWLEVAAAVVALAACLIAHRAERRTTDATTSPEKPAARASWTVATLAVVALALTPARSGHAAAVQSWTALTVVADAAHVLGAGGWLGTLFVVLIVGIPTAVTLPSAARGKAVAALVNAFSPSALVSAGVLAATGVYAGIVHVGTFSALWGTDYGRTLLIKLGVLTPVALTGLYNWRVVRPALGDDRGTVRVRRSAAAELLIGVVVLGVTAVLVATSTPDQGSHSAVTPAGVPPPAATRADHSIRRRDGQRSRRV